MSNLAVSLYTTKKVAKFVISFSIFTLKSYENWTL